MIRIEHKGDIVAINNQLITHIDLTTNADDVKLEGYKAKEIYWVTVYFVGGDYVAFDFDMKAKAEKLFESLKKSDEIVGLEEEKRYESI